MKGRFRSEFLLPSIQSHGYSLKRQKRPDELQGPECVYVTMVTARSPHKDDVTSFSLLVWEEGTVGMGFNCGLDGVSSFQCQ